MKKILILFSLLSVFLFPVSASSADKVKESILENGLSVFTLEDFSNPLVRIELCVRAGYSYQSESNAGFFELLTEVIRNSSRTDFAEVRCSSDSIHFVLNVSPAILEETLMELSASVFNPFYSDEILNRRLTEMKRNILQYTQDPSFLINSGIDSRVFSEEPWKNDSGVYPQSFSRINTEDARLILNDIHQRYFVPQNSAVFLSGNFHQAEGIHYTEEAFGNYFSNRKFVFKPVKAGTEGGRRFVIHDKQLSPDFSQVVVQYAASDSDTSEMVAALYNPDDSELKRKLESDEVLGIPGGEYINIASAFKAGCSRVIVQTLLQNTKNWSPVEQTERFLSVLKEAGKDSGFGMEEYGEALYRRINSFSRMTSSSSAFMESLASFWAVRPYFDGILFSESLEGISESSTVREMISKNRSFGILEPEQVLSFFASDEPYVFVILNTKQFNKFKKAFKNAGFEEITKENSAWFTSEIYRNRKISDKGRKQNNSGNYADDFYESNRKSLFEYKLPNGIPLFVKENFSTNGITILFSIEGGKLNSKDDHGFEEVMVNVLSTNMMHQIKKKQTEKLILHDFEIRSETLMDSSRIIIECETEDFQPILNAAAYALIMDEVIPSDADRIVQGRRTRKRLENGSTVNQLYSAAINRMYPDSDYAKIFDAKNEILGDTSYEKILQNYPTLLNARRFSVIVSGNINRDEAFEKVDRIFSVLQEQSFLDLSGANRVWQEIPVPDFPVGKTQKTKLNHTFLTDVSAKDAGPMPAVLIPTKSFADPVLFCIKAPETDSPDFAVFNAVLVYLQNSLTSLSSGRNDLFNCSVSVSTAGWRLPFGTISFSSVERTSAAESVYSEALEKLCRELSETGSSGKTLRKIKDIWTASEFGNALTNTGSALLIDNSIHGKPASAGAAYETYREVNALESSQVLEVVEKYFKFDLLFRLYSADSKR